MGLDERHGAILELIRLSQQVKVDQIVDRLMVSVIADKFGHMAMVRVCGFDRVDSLLATHGVETIIADEAS